VLNRPRHQELIRQIREAGARIRLIEHGDVAAAIQAAMEDYTAVDALMGIGGATEAVLAAAAIKCIGGTIQCKIWPRDDKERAKLKAAGVEEPLCPSRGGGVPSEGDLADSPLASESPDLLEAIEPCDQPAYQGPRMDDDEIDTGWDSSSSNC